MRVRAASRSRHERRARGIAACLALDRVAAGACTLELSAVMSTSAGPSASRGDITLQPSYFTSSLYVEPLREDISSLITLYAQQYSQTNPPFALFKRLWTELGWSWLHFKVFDPRARESFLRVTQRLFLGAHA